MDNTLTIEQLNTILDALNPSDQMTWVRVFLHAGGAFQGTAHERQAFDLCTAWARRYPDRHESTDRPREIANWKSQSKVSNPAGALVRMAYDAGLSKADLFRGRGITKMAQNTRMSQRTFL